MHHLWAKLFAVEKAEDEQTRDLAFIPGIAPYNWEKKFRADDTGRGGIIIKGERKRTKGRVLKVLKVK